MKLCKTEEKHPVFCGKHLIWTGSDVAIQIQNYQNDSKNLFSVKKNPTLKKSHFYLFLCITAVEMCK